MRNGVASQRALWPPDARSDMMWGKGVWVLPIKL